MTDRGEGYKPKTEIDIEEGDELTKDNIGSLAKEVIQVRFVRAGDRMWILNSEYWNHLLLTTQIAHIPEEEIKEKVQDAGYIISLGDGTLLVRDTSSHLNNFVHETKQRENRPQTLEVLKKMGPNLTITEKK